MQVKSHVKSKGKVSYGKEPTRGEFILQHFWGSIINNFSNYTEVAKWAMSNFCLPQPSTDCDVSEPEAPID